MTAQQKHLLMLLKEIDAICRKHGIVYYLAGGSLIGAVRHEGFIPWDDDADILMTQKNWKRFMEVAKTELPEGRALGAPEVSRDYPNTFGRYIDLTSAAIHKNQILYEGFAGTVIDIFPLDPIPDDPKKIRRYRRDLTLYSDLINECSVYSHPDGANRIRYPLFRLLSRLAGRDRVLKYLEKRMFSYPEEECRLTILRWGGNVLLSEKEWYGTPQDMKFEDTFLMGPSKPVEYLTWHYGDEWMYLPRHSEQEGHLAVYSQKIGYEEIQNTYLPLVSKKRLRRTYLWKKTLMIQLAEQRHNYFDQTLLFSFTLAKAELEKKLRKESLDVEQLFAHEQFGQLNGIFEQYFAVQLHASSIGRDDFAGAYRYFNPKIIDIAPRLQIIALYTLVHTGQLGRAHALLTAYQRAQGGLTEDQQKVRELVDAIRHAIFSYSGGNRDGALQETNALLGQYANNISLLKLKVRILLEKADDSATRSEALAIIERLERLTPGDGEILKYRADCDYRAGKKREAYEKYCHALRTTNNGYIHLEIKRICEKNVDELIQLTNILHESGASETAMALVQMAREMLPGPLSYRMQEFTLRRKQCKTFSERQLLLADVQDLRLSLNEAERETLDRFAEAVWRADGLSETILPLKLLVWDAPASPEAYQKAKTACSQRAEKEPDNGDVVKLIADLYLINYRQDQAFHFYRKAVSLPHSAYTHQELEWIYRTDQADFERKYFEYRDLHTQLSMVTYEWRKKHLSLNEYIAVWKKLETDTEVRESVTNGDTQGGRA